MSMKGQPLPRKECPFCGWKGANNKYAKHITGCPALQADGAGGEVSQ